MLNFLFQLFLKETEELQTSEIYMIYQKYPINLTKHTSYSHFCVTAQGKHFHNNNNQQKAKDDKTVVIENCITKFLKQEDFLFHSLALIVTCYMFSKHQTASWPLLSLCFTNTLLSLKRFHSLLPKNAVLLMYPTTTTHSESYSFVIQIRSKRCCEGDVNVYNIYMIASHQMQIRRSLSLVREQFAHFRVHILLLLLNIYLKLLKERPNTFIERFRHK